MHLDVADLRDFYGTALGRTAARLLAAKIRARWPRTRGETIAGLGFCSPYLEHFTNEGSTLAALMPETQGALIWPADGPVSSALVHEGQLPLFDNTVDRLLLVHCLELSEHVSPLLRELWRVLKPEGRLLIVVPNRRGIWAHLDRTPFGHGQPFSRSQLEALLRDSLFTPVDCESALHVPPLSSSAVLRWAVAIERFGNTASPGLGGVLIVEATKETVAPVGGKTARVRAIRDLVPVRKPAASSVTPSEGQTGA